MGMDIRDRRREPCTTLEPPRKNLVAGGSRSARRRHVPPRDSDSTPSACRFHLPVMTRRVLLLPRQQVRTPLWYRNSVMCFLRWVDSLVAPGTHVKPPPPAAPVPTHLATRTPSLSATPRSSRPYHRLYLHHRK